MATQLIFYQTAIPVSRSRHSECFIDASTDYSFSDQTNSVPLMAVEFPPAASEYPIVFAGADDELLPAAVLGMRNSQNLFVSREHAWEARYIPAFIRRYPFVFSRSQQGKQFLLCIDEAYPGFNREGRGQPLFDADGNPSAFVGNVLKFLQEYQVQFRRSRSFCGKIRELGLLEPMQAQVTVDKGPPLSLTGFMAVNRAKLKALPADKLAELAQTDELELLYLHLQSMRNFEGLKDRLGIASKDEGEERPATGASRSRKGAGKAKPDKAATTSVAAPAAAAGEGSADRP